MQPPPHDQPVETPEEKLAKKAAHQLAKIRRCYVPAVFSTPNSVINISAGKDWACGIDIDNILYCWGVDRSADDSDSQSAHSELSENHDHDHDSENEMDQENSADEEADVDGVPNLRTVNSDREYRDSDASKSSSSTS